MEHFADREGTIAALCERAFVRYLDGGCSSPVAAHAVIEGDEIFLRGLYYQESTGKHKIGTMRGSVKDPETLGVNLAKKLVWEVGKMSRQGKVWLVGAGPGDVGLFTIKGKDILAKAGSCGI